MQHVLSVIHERRERYERHPFLQFLRDETRSAEERLSFAPYTSHFVLTFAEFNRTFLRCESADDWMQKCINAHSEEDARHFAWFLQDLKTLGFDRNCSLTDALKFAWSDEGRQSRALGYFIISAAANAEPEMRLALIEAVESMGNACLEAIVVAARQHPAHDKLIYFGQHHLDRETGHAIGGDQGRIQGIEFSPEQRERAVRMVHQLFDRMEAFNAELLQRVEAAPTRLGSGADSDFMALRPGSTRVA